MQTTTEPTHINPKTESFPPDVFCDCVICPNCKVFLDVESGPETGIEITQYTVAAPFRTSSTSGHRIPNPYLFGAAFWTTLCAIALYAPGNLWLRASVIGCSALLMILAAVLWLSETIRSESEALDISTTATPENL